MGKSKISILREAILSDLTDQLDRNGTTGQYYSDLVKDYMKLWDTKNRLILDIELRGLTVVSYTHLSGTLRRRVFSIIPRW